MIKVIKGFFGAIFWIAAAFAAQAVFVGGVGLAIAFVAYLFGFGGGGGE